MIFGASGGMGHLALQLGKRMGARVLAVASGADGVALAKRLGADAVVEGHSGDVEASAREFAPDGIDAALITAGGKAVERALTSMRDGGRVAYPYGVRPEPIGRSRLQVQNFSANFDRETMVKLNELIDLDPFEVHIDRTFHLEKVDEAHLALGSHYLGRLALQL
jgi:NADPH:quinone reductase-like Zn-dependent oxidoreductase